MKVSSPSLYPERRKSFILWSYMQWKLSSRMHCMKVREESRDSSKEAYELQIERVDSG
jgi:hypothetical protein